MSVPDPSLPTAACDGSLVKLSILRDAKGSGPDDLLHDVHVAHVVDTSDPSDVGRLDLHLPGAGALLAACRVGKRKTQISDRQDATDRFLSIADPCQPTPCFWQRRAELRKSVLRVNGQTAVLVQVWRVRGVDASELGRLSRALERTVAVTAESAQRALPLSAPMATPANGAAPGRPRSPGRGWDGAIGSIVTGQAAQGDGTRRPVAGMVVSAQDGEDGARLLQVEDVFDGAVWMTDGEVESSIRVATTGHKSIPELLAFYATEAARAGVAASWSWLVSAMGVAYAGGTLTADDQGAWALTPEVIGEAVDLAAGRRAVG